MPAKTNNIYGKIVISDKSIAHFVYETGKFCYGIVDFHKFDFITSFRGFLKYGSGIRGVLIKCSGDRISMDLCVVVKYGVSINAVIESLKEALKYKVEKFTGMIVDTINVDVAGISK